MEFKLVASFVTSTVFNDTAVRAHRRINNKTQLNLQTRSQDCSLFFFYFVRGSSFYFVRNFCLKENREGFRQLVFIKIFYYFIEYCINFQSDLNIRERCKNTSILTSTRGNFEISKLQIFINRIC